MDDLGSGNGYPCIVVALLTGAWCSGVDLCAESVAWSNRIWTVIKPLWAERHPNLPQGGRCVFREMNLLEVLATENPFCLWIGNLLFWKVKDKDTGATLDGLTRLAIMICPSIKKTACFSEIVPGTRRSNGQCGAAEKREHDFFKRAGNQCQRAGRGMGLPRPSGGRGMGLFHVFYRRRGEQGSGKYSRSVVSCDHLFKKNKATKIHQKKVIKTKII